MTGFLAVYLRELALLRRRLKKQAGAALVSPLLYLVTFGYGLGGGMRTDGHDYLVFLLPGLAAMSSMTQAFGIAAEINVSRFYTGIFEEIQASPCGRTAYVLGEIAAGLTRVLLGCGVVLLLGLAFGIRIHAGVGFWLAALLNGFAFSGLAVALAMALRSHADQGLLTTFVITPMAFLGGTFFPLDRLPEPARSVVAALPLSHAATAMRADALGLGLRPLSMLVLAAYGLAFFLLARHMVARAKD